MQKLEAKAQTLFNHWLKEVFLPKHKYGFFVFELKHTRGKNYLNFNEVADHQVEALLSASEGGFVFKISDSGLGQKPFDCFALKGCPAYVVIFYPKSFELIPIAGFLLEKKRSVRKSLLYSRAQAISTISVPL